MRLNPLALGLVALVVLASSPAALPGSGAAAARPDGGAAVAWPSAHEANLMIGRGLKAVTPLERSFDVEGVAVSAEEAADIAVDGGFTSIRLPTRLAAAFDLEPPYALLDPGYLDEVTAELAVLTAHGLTVSLSCNCFEQTSFGDPERFVAVWSQIATLFADQPPSVFFEVANEPFLSADELNSALAAVIPAIRASNPERIVIVPSRGWSPPTSVPDLDLPDDGHLIATFHHYDPMPFTHQGSYFPGSDAWLGTAWSASVEAVDVMQAYLEPAVCWSRETGIPLYMGEFGVLGAAPDDEASSSAWVSTAARLAEAEGISWTYFALSRKVGTPWDFEADDWIPWMLEALQPSVDERLEPWATCGDSTPTTTVVPSVPEAAPPAVATPTLPAFTG